MHCCGAARSRIPICLLRNHPSGDPRLLCCSRLMVVPSLMIEGSSSSSSCLVAQNTPVCAALLIAADRALLLPELRLLRDGECRSLSNPPGTSGRREPAAAPTRTCRGTASTRTAHTGNTATQAINILPWAQWGGSRCSKPRGGNQRLRSGEDPTRDFFAASLAIAR